MRQPDGTGALTTDTPIYDPATKLFRQSMTFRSDKVTLNSTAIVHVTEGALKQFAISMQLNGLDDFAWPPDQIEMTPHADQKGAQFVFGTRADKRKPVILLQ